jgi:hypothetical protein
MTSVVTHGEKTPSLPRTHSVPQIRHAGRAHVRGKIRRVWRHRYLELWDNGLVRYYELPSARTNEGNFGSSSTTAESPHPEDAQHPHRRVQKYTLAIYHARILDVTTLRDIHVGLPRGSFGFLFRGQRLLHLETDEEDEQEDVIVDALDDPSGTTTMRTLEPQSQSYHQQQYQHHHSLSALALLSTPSIMMPTRRHNKLSASCQGETPKEQRDFLCAVSSLEEAQSWVVALQWASTQQQHQRGLVSEPWWLSPSPTGTPTDTRSVSTTALTTAHSTPANTRKGAEHELPIVVDDFDDDTSSWEIHDTPKVWTLDGSASSPSSPRNSPARSTNAVAISTVPPVSPTTTGTTNASVSTAIPGHCSAHKATHAIAPSSSPSKGKVVVTKVTTFRMVRLLGMLKFEVSYEIHGLLLKSVVVHDSAETATTWQAESWVLLRTADDFQTLLSDLCQELGSSLLDQVQLEAIRKLPRYRQFPSFRTVQSSLSTVDSILRSLVMDASMVNAKAMKKFLGIGTTTGAADQTNTFSSDSFLRRFWQAHASQSTLQNKTRTLPPRTRTDQYVKSWLQSCRSDPSIWDVYAVRWLRRPWWLVSGIGVTAASIVPLARWWQRAIPVLAVRLDVLVVSWLGAAYFGRWVLLIPGTERSAANTILSNRSATTTPQKTAKSVSATTGDTQSKTSITKIPNALIESQQMQLEGDNFVDSASALDEIDYDGEESEGEEASGLPDTLDVSFNEGLLSSPLPQYPRNDGVSCWSQPPYGIFHVRGNTYLQDRVKVPSGPAPLTCRGVDVWMTDNPERHIARHPAVLGGKLDEHDTFLVNFLLPFGNFVAYFSIPPLDKFPDKLRQVWLNFLKGDQQYRDARLKLLPIVIEGPWIVKTAVGPGKSPALLGKVIPLQYFFRDPEPGGRKGVYEVDVIITASTIAKGILSVVRGHTKAVTIGFAFIIEASKQEELPETVLCSFQVHSLHLEDCPLLPVCNLDKVNDSVLTVR